MIYTAIENVFGDIAMHRVVLGQDLGHQKHSQSMPTAGSFSLKNDNYIRVYASYFDCSSVMN